MKLIFLSVCILATAYSTFAQKGFSLVDLPASKKVEVRYDGKLFTAYCYFDSTEKPVLFPIKTTSGVTITRGYPIAPRPGERTDHPHHVGLWLNYESVNGLDFWNNSDAITPERKPHYGSIRHVKVVSKESKKDKARLEASSQWVDHTGKVLLDETTLFVFMKSGNDYIIDRVSTLVAKVPEVVFKDVKDGMLAIRVSRQLEQPSKENSKYVDAHGNVTTVPPSDTQVTGLYANQEGVTGDNVWGKRSKWASLNGTQDGEPVSVVIIDHPKNPGYPTYWHARGYGLFAANPLGQKVFSEGKEELNLVLSQGQKAVFRHRIIIHAGSTMAADAINKQADEFGKTSY
ncbi:MAG TPA: PmoA family protein [Chryseolinea sp.]